MKILNKSLIQKILLINHYKYINKLIMFVTLTIIISACRSDFENSEIPKINKKLIISDYDISVIDSLFKIYKPNDYLAGMKLIILNKKDLKKWYNKYFWDTCKVYGKHYVYIGHHLQIIEIRNKEIKKYNSILKDSIFDIEYIKEIKDLEGSSFKNIKQFKLNQFIDFFLKDLINSLEENRRDLNYKEDIWSHILLSEIYSAIEDYKYSNEVLFEALDKEPANPLILDLITQNYIFKGELEDAKYYFNLIDINYPKSKYQPLKKSLDSLKSYYNEYYNGTKDKLWK